jgi:hypothetical protein
MSDKSDKREIIVWTHSQVETALDKWGECVVHNHPPGVNTGILRPARKFLLVEVEAT